MLKSFDVAERDFLTGLLIDLTCSEVTCKSLKWLEIHRQSVIASDFLNETC